MERTRSEKVKKMQQTVKPKPVGAETIRRELIEIMGLSYDDTIAACEHVAKELRAYNAKIRFGKYR